MKIMIGGKRFGLVEFALTTSINIYVNFIYTKKKIGYIGTYISTGRRLWFASHPNAETFNYQRHLSLCMPKINSQKIIEEFPNRNQKH